jgi:hypothetical protein
MQLPRWLVRALLALSALSALAVVLGLWLAWPERTARQMINLVRQGRFAETNGMLVHASWTEPAEESSSFIALDVTFPDGQRMGRHTFPGLWQHDFAEPNLELHSRSLLDQLLGRQIFHAAWTEDLNAVFAAQRGKVYFLSIDKRDEHEPYKQWDPWATKVQPVSSDIETE